jgi:nitrite reductase (NADH) small subunit
MSSEPAGSSSGAAPATRERLRVVIPKSELGPGGRTVITVRRREILVINDDGRPYAIFNRCPHHQAPLALGRLAGTSRACPVGTFEFDPAHRVMRCPWHHYEFELESGRCLADPDRYRIATYPVRDEGENFVILV